MLAAISFLLTVGLPTASTRSLSPLSKDGRELEAKPAACDDPGGSDCVARRESEPVGNSSCSNAAHWPSGLEIEWLARNMLWRLGCVLKSVADELKIRLLRVAFKSGVLTTSVDGNPFELKPSLAAELLTMMSGSTGVLPTEISSPKNERDGG